jgi:uncharacterized protein (DUF885 family)
MLHAKETPTMVERGNRTSLAIIACLSLALPCPLLAQATQAASQQAAAPSAATRSADARLKALYDAEFAWSRADQGRGTGFGPDSAGDRLPRVDPASQAARLAYWDNVLKELDRIPLDQLSPDERINAQVFRTAVEIKANNVRWKGYEIPFNTDTFFWTSLSPLPGMGFQTADQYRRYISRINDIPRYFDENIANMRSGLARGFSNPKVVLTGRDKTAEPYLAPNESNPLFGPFKAMPPSIPPEEQARLKAEGLAAIQSRAVPAYDRLLAFLRSEYFPKARTTLGASELPDGRAFYRSEVRDFTTTDLTPAEIHQIGLREVARIRADMEATMRSTGFKGSLAEFMTFLRTDPQFYAKTPKELMAAASYVVMKANGRMNDTIGTLPRYRHGIVPVPAAIAPIYTSGRGGLANCQFNTYDLPSRPLYTLPALALHECTPGHSFQAALALEAPERPDFRKELYFSGYGEGWGLYTEWLGQKMGIYETPYEEFGRQTYEMWRAVRLVIDTGIHEYGWSRDKALAYFRDNVALSELEITNEVDRYISWPGQALAYKLGELKIRELRTEAEQTLGPKFDQRKFHDVILGMGAVPLTVLESEVRRWIRETDAAGRAG